MQVLPQINSLKARLALGTGVLFTLLLATVFVFIYTSFSQFRKDDFYARLRDRAVTTYKLLVEVEAIDSNLLKVIDTNTHNSVVPQQKLMIFQDARLIYNYGAGSKAALDTTMFSAIRKEKEIVYTVADYEVLGHHEERNGDHYYVLSSGNDIYGLRKLSFLKWTMLLAYFSGIIFAWVSIYFFVKRMIRPLDALQANLSRIDDASLSTRLPETGQGKEVDSLSADINQLLARLEKAFRFQKDFVHYASHELRTPLSAMVGLTESTLNSTKTPAQFQQVLKQLLQQQKNLTDITNSLLLLSDGNNEGANKNYPLERLDELIFRTAEIMEGHFPDSSIEINVDGALVSENAFLLPGHEPMLMIAFGNLLKNALQYSSDKKAIINLDVSGKHKVVCFKNAGTAIPPEERHRIFTPFYRSLSTSTVKGHGLGLPLVQQIIRLHSGEVQYKYVHPFNVFTVTFL